MTSSHPVGNTVSIAGVLSYFSVGGQLTFVCLLHAFWLVEFGLLKANANRAYKVRYGQGGFCEIVQLDLSIGSLGSSYAVSQPSRRSPFLSLYYLYHCR